MPSELSTPNGDQPNVTSAHALPRLADEAPPRSAAEKGAATVRRRKEARRADRLDEIRVQIADGTLVVHQMTDAQHKAALRAAREAVARQETRREEFKALGKYEP
jgi:uncharacterized protein (DUF2336 family)